MFNKKWLTVSLRSAAPDEVTAEKTAGGVVELLGDFLTDAAPALRILLYGFRINDFLDDGEVLREPGAAGRFNRADGVIDRASPQRVTGGGHAGGVGFSRRRGRAFHSGQEQLQLRGVPVVRFWPRKSGARGR